MFFTSKKSALVILGITALICSRTLFAFFNDPEGPNLLVVIVMAAILYLPSLAVLAFNATAAGSKKLIAALLIQIGLVIIFYFLLS
jgi:hypothetical protein